MKPKTPPESVEEYLAEVPKEPRATLERLRKIIRAAAPNASEIISYQIPRDRWWRSTRPRTTAHSI